METGRIKIVTLEESMPYDFHCSCGHIAAGHWFVSGDGIIFSGRCHECRAELSSNYCRAFKADNLVHLEKLVKEVIK